MYILPNSTHTRTTDKCIYSVNIYTCQITAETYQYITICKYGERTTPRKKMDQ